MVALWLNKIASCHGQHMMLLVRGVGDGVSPPVVVSQANESHMSLQDSAQTKWILFQSSKNLPSTTQQHPQNAHFGMGSPVYPNRCAAVVAIRNCERFPTE